MLWQWRGDTHNGFGIEFMGSNNKHIELVQH